MSSEISMTPKILFTPGPSHPILEGVKVLSGASGRGDLQYQEQEALVSTWLKKLSGQDQLVSFQGSGSFAVEMMVMNFVKGRVLLIQTGYYSNRLFSFLEAVKGKADSQISEVVSIDASRVHEVSGSFDWICACYVETARGSKLNIESLGLVAARLGARVALDAVASIGLERGHDLADVVAFSSCKGLFGPTGASFIGYSIEPIAADFPFYFDLQTHAQKKVTGPYSQIQYLSGIIDSHESWVDIVRLSKRQFTSKFHDWLCTSEEFEPWISTRVSGRLTSRNSKLILYSPREQLGGSVACHFGQVGHNFSANFLDDLQIEACS